MSSSDIPDITNEEYAQVYRSVAYKHLIENLSPCKWLPSELAQTIPTIGFSIGLIAVSLGIEICIIDPHIFD